MSWVLVTYQNDLQVIGGCRAHIFLRVTPYQLSQTSLVGSIVFTRILLFT